MIERIGQRLSAWAERCVPNPFIFAVLLTLLAFALAFAATDASLGEVLGAWGKGFWELLAFGMQMCLVLVTGHALANSRPLKALIAALARVPKTGPAAVTLVAAVAGVGGLLNWGLGLIVGALLAREVALRGLEQGRRFHYPLLAAAGYVAMLVWHGGLSGSAPLLVATKGHFLEAKIGLIDVSRTLYSPLNIVVALTLLTVVSLLAGKLHPRQQIKTAADFGVVDDEPTPREPAQTVAEKFERGRALSLLAGALGAAFLLREVYLNGFHPDLNLVNLAFLSLGLLLHDSPRSYLGAVEEGARACAGIILQFPFYAGIMGVMKYTGLMQIMATAVSGHVGPTLFPVMTFFSAGIVNIFVPSGGGQWAVQGPIAVEAARLLDVSLPKTVMAVAYGDEWTNMFQPFWALALLGITRLRASDIMGYTVLFLLVTMPIFLLGLLLIPM